MTACRGDRGTGGGIQESIVSVEVIEPVQRLIERQIAAGHGKEGFARIYEELRSRAS